MRAMALTLAASSLLSNALVSQRPMRQAQGAGQGAAPNAGPMQGEGRAQLEGRVRREFARVVRNRVGLSDEQMQKLGPLTQRLEEQRRSLQMDERDARVALQGIILGDTPTDSAKVDQLLDNLLDVQRKRLQLAESEQKELATFMTPIQRAKYLAMQEQVRRRLEQLRPPPGAPFGDGPQQGRGRRQGPPVPPA